MPKMIAVHSYKGGTGKSILATNLAYIYASYGKKVLLVDMDFRAPTLVVAFEFPKVKKYFNSYLNGECDLEDTFYDASHLVKHTGGELKVALADPSTEAIREMLIKTRKWEMDALRRLFAMKDELFDELGYDYCVIDTSPGIHYSSINAIVVSDLALVVITLDDSDMDGTRRMIKELYNIFERKSMIVINKVVGPEAGPGSEKKKLVETMQRMFMEPIVGVLPCVCELTKYRRSRIFAHHYPRHPFTKAIKEIAAKIE